MSSSPSALTLVLIRHGQTEWAHAGRVAGQSDIDLSDAGRAEVTSLATRLVSLPVQAWYCSPMRRTRQTSSLLRSDNAARWPAEQFDTRLVELDFGDWEGELWQSVYQQHGDLMKDWGEDWVNRSPPGGERFRDQAQRCAQWLADVVDDPGSAGQDGAVVVAVSHAGSIRALLCHCLGWPLERAMSIEIDTASLCVLEYQPSRERWLARQINGSGWPSPGLQAGPLRRS